MRLVLPVLALVVLLVGACGDPSGPGAPRSIVITGGGDQIGVVGTAFGQPITVTAFDGANRPVPGVRVTWGVESGGGTLDRSESSTNRDGQASVTWTAGPISGAQRLHASAEGLSVVTIELEVQAGPPVTIFPLTANGMVAEPGADLPQPLRVLLRDAYENPVANRAVRFAASSGILSDTLRQTDAAGVARARWTLGPAGEQTVHASVPETQLALTFTALAIAHQDVPVLESGIPVTGLSASTGTPHLFRIPVPQGATRLVVRAEGGNGDADLYLRAGGFASTSLHHCASTTPQSLEQCLVRAPAAGDWFVLIDAWSAYTDLTLTAEWIIGGSMQVTVTGIQPGHADVSVSGPNAYHASLGETTLLSGLDPGTYTITADHVQLEGSVYVATPGLRQVEIVSAAQADVDVSYAVNSGGLNFDVLHAHITQSVQRPDGSVPLITGRDALLRVFARANAETNERPEVRARIYHDGVLVDTRMAEAPGGGAPIAPDEESLSGSWNIRLPGDLVRPGMSFRVDVDPDNGIAETDESDNAYPADGDAHAPDVRSAAPFRARLVPVLQSANGLTGDVNTGNLAAYVDRTYSVYPLADMDVDVRNAYTFTGALAAQYDSTWNRLLQEIRLLSVADGSERYYYGVIKPSYDRGGTGYGYIGLPAAVGVDWSNLRAETLAHEWGHNFGRRHVACGGPANPDPNYPHANGAIAHPGWDLRTGELHASSLRYDLMSYCDPTWSSDYTYEAVMQYREDEAAVAAAREPVLVVWGRISEDGVILEPAFETVAAPVLPKGGGRYTLSVTAADGGTLATLRFDGNTVDHAPDARHFAYAVPLRMLRGRAPAQLHLRGAGVDVVRPAAPAGGPAPDVRVTRIDGARVRVQWDAVQSPLAVVRDATTGEILSFARGGAAVVESRDRELQVELSNGVRSHMRRRVTVQ
ncbi:MAG TPA: Ig-like domain-containing protein [Longimicrobiales bacterium]|nr:Ig-like domain-containing protein [Longimicrobiales bacterium]